MKKKLAILFSVLMIITTCIPAYADTMFYKGEVGSPITTGTWSMDAAGDWHYTTTEAFKNTWAYIANPYNNNKPAWFIFDETGKMLTGWQLLYWNGSYQYYYFHEVSDGKKGECQLGGKTPDGYYVDSTGAWIVNGVTQEYVPVSASSDSSNGLAVSNARGLYPMISQLLLPADGPVVAQPGSIMLSGHMLSSDTLKTVQGAALSGRQAGVNIIEANVLSGGKTVLIPKNSPLTILPREPQIIETITLEKDAASTAIYGTRGAN